MPRCGIRKTKTKKHRSRSKSGVALCHGVPPSRSLLAPFPRSLLLKRTETLATRAMADRESSVALCHGVALKKKGSVEDRESGVALCHKVALKKERERERSVADRESSIAQCHGVALKKKKGEKMIGRGPRERCIAIPQFGINNALQGRKECNSKGVWEGAESRSLCCFN